MFFKTFVTAIVLLLTIQGLFAQEFVFKPLKASGDMPDDFAKNKIDLFLEEEKAISRNQKKRDFNQESDFILYSVFTIANMMNSGSVLYNDEITAYVNEVADKVLADDPELRSKLRFYTLKSPEINAFSTQQGIIFVTTGLISQLETEAQLAFVLAHETSHYEREHNLNTYKERGKISRSRYLDPDEKLSSYFTYKQENELEADEDGVKRYLKTDYNTSAINQAFNVLLYSYLPFDEIAFDYAYVENEGSKIPEKMRLDEVKEISAVEDVDDQNSTHPNIKKRKSRVKEMIPTKEKGQDFLVSEERYRYLQRLSRYQITDQHLKVANYARAFYNAFLISRKYGDEKASKRYAAMALYGLAEFKKSGKGSETYDNYKSVEGESQRVHYLFKRLDKRSSAALAVKFCWEYHLQYPEDELMKRIAHDALLLLSESSISKTTWQRDWVRAEEDDVELSEEEIKKLSKYEKIEYKKKMRARKDKEKYFYAFYLVDLLKNDTFEQAFDEVYLNGSTNFEEEDEEEMEEYEFEEAEEDDTGLDRERKLDYGVREAPQISRALMLRPRYDLMDHRGRTSFREMMFTTEERELSLMEFYKTVSKSAGLEIEFLDNKSDFDTERFNDYSQMIEWLREKVNTDEVDMVSFCSLEMDALMEKYQADHLLLSTMNEEIDKKTFEFFYFLFAVAYVVPLPFYIYSQFFKPEVEFNRNTVLFNLKTGEVVYANGETFYSKFRKDLVKAGIYYELSRMKN